MSDVTSQTSTLFRSVILTSHLRFQRCSEPNPPIISISSFILGNLTCRANTSTVLLSYNVDTVELYDSSKTKPHQIRHATSVPNIKKKLRRISKPPPDSLSSAPEQSLAGGQFLAQHRNCSAPRDQRRAVPTATSCSNEDKHEVLPARLYVSASRTVT